MELPHSVCTPKGAELARPLQPGPAGTRITDGNGGCMAVERKGLQGERGQQLKAAAVAEVSHGQASVTDHASELRQKIDSRSAKVGIVGLGYVGLPLALTFAERAFFVLGFDVDRAKIEALGA